MNQSFYYFFRLWALSLFIWSPLNSLHSNSTFCDETTLSFGLAKQDFRIYTLNQQSAPDKIYQHHYATSPCMEFGLRKHVFKNWQTFWSLNAYYDLGMDSETAFNSGKEIYDAHSWNIDIKGYLLHENPYISGLRLGLGAGAGNFALYSHSEPNADYVNYGHLLAPVLRAEKDYKIRGIAGTSYAEICRLDFFGYANGQGYSLGNTLWLKKNDEVEQGFKVQFVYWNLDAGEFLWYHFMNDFHGISWSMELRFR